jgi:hypothetical protein
VAASSSSSSLLLQASLLGQKEVVKALLHCLLLGSSHRHTPLPLSSDTGSDNVVTTDTTEEEAPLATLLRLGNEELITPLMGAVAEGHENITMVMA